MSAVEVEGLGLRLGGRDVLRGASLRVGAGEAVVLTGPSGSGKSALLRLALGLRPRASQLEVRGRVSLLGEDALRTPTQLLARRAGLLFQDAALQLTQPDVAAELAFRPENLGLPGRDVEARVEAAARRFGLAPMLARPVGALSGGERKRLALASLLAAEPEVLLLDEPLGGLDEAWRTRVVSDLRREARGRALLVAEHRAAQLRPLGARVLVIRDGAPRPATARGPRRGRMPPRRDASPWPAVLAQDVTARLGGGEVLRGATFEASPGVTLLVGPNGSGKSTLLRALLGLVPAEGTLRLCGLDPRREHVHRLARFAGYVPQRAEDLFSQPSVGEEIAFGPARLGADVRGVAAQLGLAHLLDRHPLTLSGGEQQRLALACALAHGPRVLLLDEPTVGLDAAGLEQALAAVQRARRDVAVVIASHDPELRGLADSVAVMDRGRVVRQAPPRRLEVPA